MTDFEVMPWFGPNPYIYTISNNQAEIIFAPYTHFYIEPWTPKGEKEGQYVWKLNLNTLATEPILYEDFIKLKPQFQGKTLKIFELIKQQINDEDVKSIASDNTVLETIAFKAKDKSYEVKLSVSELNKTLRKSKEIIVNKTPEQKQAVYYSGIMHFQIFESPESTQPIVYLKKQFKDWDYPLKSQGKKYTQRSIIASFCKLYFLPNSKPCFMLSSTVYQGRIYEHKSSIEDEIFSLIVP